MEKDEIYKYGPEQIKEGVDKLSTYDRLIGHNIIVYDIPVLYKLHAFKFPRMAIDTLVLSRLANPDRGVPYGWKGPWRPHGLEAWGKRLGGKQKVEHKDWSQFSEEMMNRCVTDVEINESVYKALYYEFKE